MPSAGEKFDQSQGGRESDVATGSADVRVTSDLG